jgi:hypothetical protein
LEQDWSFEGRESVIFGVGRRVPFRAHVNANKLRGGLKEAAFAELDGGTKMA